MASTLCLQTCQGARAEWSDERWRCLRQHPDESSGFCSSDNLQVANPALSAKAKSPCENSTYTVSEESKAVVLILGSSIPCTGMHTQHISTGLQLFCWFRDSCVIYAIGFLKKTKHFLSVCGKLFKMPQGAHWKSSRNAIPCCLPSSTSNRMLGAGSIVSWAEHIAPWTGWVTPCNIPET